MVLRLDYPPDVFLRPYLVVLIGFRALAVLEPSLGVIRTRAFFQALQSSLKFELAQQSSFANTPRMPYSAKLLETQANILL